MVTCKNCAALFEGKYCPNCRQAADTERITWHEIAHHLPHALFHTDMGLLYTIKELALRPGNTLRDYLDGKRAYHFNPFLFLILLGGFGSLLFIGLHVQLPVKEIQLEKIESVSATVAHKYFAMVGLLFITLLSLTDYLFYFSKKYVLPELIIFNTFQAGQIMALTLAFFPLLLLQNYLAGADPLFELRWVLKTLVLCFLFFTRYQFYEAKGNSVLIAKIIVQIVFVNVLYQYVIAGMIANYLK